MSASSSEQDEQGAARIAAIVLAAGRSTRMGAQNKLLADLGGKPMVRRVVETALASRARPVLVVTDKRKRPRLLFIRSSLFQPP